MSIVSINPATGKIIAKYEEFSEQEIEERLARAEAAFERHKRTSFAERARKMLRAADLLESNADVLAARMTREMGKPITQANAEARKCAWVCRYYAENAEQFLQPEPVDTDASRSYVAFLPLGPILAIMPWNFPFWQVWRFVAAALMSGNVALLKHASNVMGCAQDIEQLLNEAGFNQDEFQALIVSSGAVPRIIEDDRIRAVTLTGGEGAGRSVGSIAGKMLKPTVLELGGSDPFIVLADADLDDAVETGVNSRMQNNGQSCIAAKRFIVEEAVMDAFLDRFAAKIGELKIGDPMETSTNIGPVATEQTLEGLEKQVSRSVEQGATVLMGGERLDREGFYFEPTILTGVKPGMVAFEEEIFGPVASVIAARDVDHAVELANQCPFGLGGAVFTRDEKKGEEVALRLEVGSAFVNGMVKSDPRLPFGGIKASGYGRELSSYGIREFVNIKTVWIA